MSNPIQALQSPKRGRVAGSKNKPLAPPLAFPGFPERLTTKEAAALLRKSPITLEIWRTTGYGPRYLKLGHSVRYLLSDLLAFEESRQHTSEAA